MRFNRKFLIALILIGSGLSYLMYSGITETTVYYYTVSEILAKPELSDNNIRVSGRVKAGTIEQSAMRAAFVVEDKEKAGEFAVVYQGVIPDTFKEHSEVILEGRFTPERSRFEANVLLAKCPSKYEGKEAAGYDPITHTIKKEKGQ